jgi:prepilin-type N-terminal cleavage/methylation domain-containing protein
VRRTTKAFTLIELLVIIAIISILAAILFPIFVGAKGAALRESCASNLHQVSMGVMQYCADYDDRFMPINYQPATTPNSRNDRTWVQMILPYVKDFAVFHCPADISARPQLEAEFDQDLVPGDADSQYYTASQRTDYGYNYQNLAPIVQIEGTWVAEPKDTSVIADPSNTILVMDSVWSRTSNGTPYGGGSWLVVPPCRYYEPAAVGQPEVDSFTGRIMTASKVYTTSYGWDPESQDSVNVYGGAWPWHLGRLNVAEVDGSVHSLDPSQITIGCDLEGQWAGAIQDPVTYMWDIR